MSLKVCCVLVLYLTVVGGKFTIMTNRYLYRCFYINSWRSTWLCPAVLASPSQLSGQNFNLSI